MPFILAPGFEHATDLATTNGKRAGLLSLPVELLLKVMENVGWKEILTIRKPVLQTTECVFKDTINLVTLFKNYHATAFQRPFFLKKPIEFCSSQDLEKVVLRWWIPYQSVDYDVQEFEICLPEGHCELLPKGVLPGSSFPLYQGQDGTLFYYNPNHPTRPHLFIPSPFSDTNSNVKTVVTFDHIGMMTLDSPSEPQMFPVEFNMAVSQYLDAAEPKAILEVYKVTHLLSESGSVSGYSCTKLAFFIEDPSHPIHSCSLNGDHLAYRFSTNQGISIVDWRALPNESISFARIYVTTPEDLKYFLLLPNRRVFASGPYDAQIWNWGERGRVTSHPPSEERWDYYFRPSWMLSFSGQHSPWGPREITQSFARGCVRLVITCYSHLVRIMIPVQANTAAGPTVGTLAEFDKGIQPFNPALNCYGYNKGIVVNRDGQNVLVQYSWPDEPAPAYVSRHTFLPMYLDETFTVVYDVQ
ncbi:hypothetical protein BKA70DRAFT_1493354 [Coprinopsis sp. MPI-PUGE-AT-0042]|nr:hypothetical protein BKA70DRAFT_1493354 [Coprinopsis sp. MPI-PUGE-AT-0042]